jgi:hypothetical protein
MRLRFLLVFSLLVLVAIAAIITYSYFGRSEEHPQGGQVDQSHTTIVWSISAKDSSVPQENVLAIREALETHDFGPVTAPNRDLEITSGRVRAEWGILYGRLLYSASQEAVPTEGLGLIVHKVSNHWQIITRNDADYCESLHQLPLTVMSQEEKDYSVGCRRP